MTAADLKHPRDFISYRRESQEHVEAVFAFSERLRVDCGQPREGRFCLLV